MIGAQTRASIFGPRLPMIYQSAVAECGLACLAMVASYYGYVTDVASLRRKYATSLRGMNFHDLRTVAEMLGMSARGVKAPIVSLARISLPAILHWNGDHFVVLRQVNRGSIVIHDPELGVQTVSLRDLERHYDGFALEIITTPEFKPGIASARENVARLFSNLPGLRSVLIQAGLLIVALELFANLVPLYMQWVIDDALVGSDLSLLNVLLLGYLVVVSLHSLTALLRSWIFLRFGTQLNAILQTRVFVHLVKLPVPYFETREIGDVVSRFHSLHAIQHTLTTATVETVIDGVMAIAVAIIIFAYSPSLSLVALGFLMIYALLRWVRYRPFKLATHEQIIAQAKVDTHFLETIRGIRSLRLFGREAVRTDQWLELLYRSYNKSVKIGYLNINYSDLGSFMASLERGVVLYLGARSVMSGTMTIGYLLAFIAYKEQFVSRAGNLIQKAVDIGLVRLQIDRLMDIVGTESDPLSQQSYMTTSELAADVSFENVGFRYSEYEPWIFRGVSLTVAAGEHVCITGRSGSGKSTLIKLLLGLSPCVEGSVAIGGVPVERLGRLLRSHVSCVMQDDQLFSGTVLDNICFFDRTPDMEWVEHCAQVAEVHEDVVRMKMGYNTIIGDMGSSLSGGQRQRILLARALYARPKILVLDESTSDLDVELERRIAENIARLKITRVSIAHRPQTIASADRIVNLDLAQPTGATPRLFATKSR